MEGASKGSTEMKPEMEKTRFPPPASWYKTNATSARDDMWAYLSRDSIVLVKPKITHTLLLNGATEGTEVVGEDGSGTKDPGRKDSMDSTWPTFEVFGYQKEDYTCLAFCQSPWDLLPVKSSPLVTGCSGGYIRIWSLETGKCVMYHDLHRDSKEVAITCLDWSVRNPNLIYSMDEEGNLISWYIPKSKLRKFSFNKIHPVTLHVCPHEDNIIAFGTKGGVIFIAKTDPEGNGACQILHKVRHDEEIVGTLWCPKLEWRYSRTDSVQNECAVLATSIQSIKPATIRLWSRNAEDRGIYNVWDKEKFTNQRFRNFSPLAWVIDPNSGSPMLVTSSKNGEIVGYNNGIITPELIHHMHTHSSIFGLVQCGDILWSTSFEPVIVGWNLRTMMVSCVIPTFKGICSITSSPSVQSYLGFGGVDACIRVVDFHQKYPMMNAVKTPMVSYRIKSKIMALAWHPSKDNWLGFGTDDGVLGYFELKEKQKTLMQFSARVSGTVYAVDWGPSVYMKKVMDSSSQQEVNDVNPANDSNKDNLSSSSFCLYACGGGKVFLIHPSSKDNKLVNVGKIIENTNSTGARLGNMDIDASEACVLPSKAADIRWSPDFSLFAVGYNDGRVELYTAPNLQLKCWIKCHARAIQFLNWRSFDFTQATKERWFASASNDATVRLFNLGDIFDPDFLSDETQTPRLIITSSATLRSPSVGDRIISTAWSPHEPSLIATVSYDSTAIVWNMKDGIPIARYMGHLHRLVACAFHPTAKHKLITASDECMYDCTVHVWDYREHPYSDKPVTSKRFTDQETAPIHIKSKEQKEKNKKEGKNKIELIEESVARIKLEENEEEEETKKNGTSSHLHVSDKTLIKGHTSDSASKKQRGNTRKNRSSKSLLPSTANVFTNSKYTLTAEIRHLVEPAFATKEQNGNCSEPKESSSSLKEQDLSMVHLGLLGNTEQCSDLLKVECESHAQKGDWEKACVLASWKSDTEFLERAIDEGHVTEMIVYLTKTLSKNLHIKACTAYAAKLIDDDEVCKAATYLMLAGLKDEAFKALIDKKLYRDAIAMMKIRTVEKDPIRSQIIQKWLVQLVQDGNLEVAAKVYCSIGMYEDALTLIEKRDTPYAWQTGIYLADKCGNTMKLESLGFKFAMDGMIKAEYDEIKRELKTYLKLKWLLPLVAVHEAIFHLSNQLRDAKDAQSADVAAQFNLKDAVFKGQTPEEMDGLKLKETVLICIAQNRDDAEMIIARSLALSLYEIKCDEELAGVKENGLKLANVWLKETDPFRFSAYEIALNKM